MTEEYIVHGKPADAIVDIFTNLTPEMPNKVFVSTDMRSYVARGRYVYVSYLGGILKWPKIMRPRIDVEVYAESRDAAEGIANICLASLLRVKHSYVGHGIRITEVRLEQGITILSDPQDVEARYVFSVRLTTTPE